jgi:hypothetical protein
LSAALISSGAVLEALAKDVVDRPPEVINWLKKLFGEVIVDFLLN